MVFRGARGRRPGLLGTIARTAVVTGTAQATSNAMNRRNNQRAAQYQTPPEQPVVSQPPVYAPPPPAPQAGEDDLISKLTQLGELHGSGVLSDEEFARAKQQLIG